MARVADLGGAVAAVESGYMKSALVASHASRRGRIESGDEVVVGLNRYTTTEPSPLTADPGSAIQSVDVGVEDTAVTAVRRWRADRDADPARRIRAERALEQLQTDAQTGANLVPATLECARADVTTGEWAGALREVFGEFRAPTGVSSTVASGEAGSDLAAVRAEVARTGAEVGRHLRVLVGKPGLDGHSNGAEQIAVRARDAGFEVVYQGIRLTPAEIVAAAVAEDVHLVGLSILSGSHLSLVPDVLDGLRAAGVVDVPVVVGGIIPEADAAVLRGLGVAAVFTPKDFAITDIMGEFVRLIRAAHGLDAAVPVS
jgi:(2R)-ethylmalonyl-CoA mutase